MTQPAYPLPRFNGNQGQFFCYRVYETSSAGGEEFDIGYRDAALGAGSIMASDQTVCVQVAWQAYTSGPTGLGSNGTTRYVDVYLEYTVGS